MKFELFAVGALLCVTLYKCDAKWCIKKKESEIQVYKPADGDWASDLFVTERIPMVSQMHVCCEGYHLVGMECVPTCEAGCPGTQKCVEPGVCGCGQGYHLEDNECSLDCGNCENGRCTEPGVCMCDPTFVRIGDKCEPHCMVNCTNGFCKTPDECTCHEGYQKDLESKECELICDLDCGANAFCSATGECQCKSGFARNEANVCQSWCMTHCKNGECVGPNECACHQGFVKIDGMCIPDCKSGCMFGDCKDEELCVCWPDYVYNATTRNCHESGRVHFPLRPRTTTTTSESPLGALRMQPEEPCPEYCPNGSCVNGVCTCSPGLVRVNLNCASHCTECQFGECVAESVCQSGTKGPEVAAVEGSTAPPSFSSESTSEASTDRTTCATGCWAGTCVDGVCQCTEGLVLSSDNDCIRPCEALCKNGICNEENVCTCHLGYVLKNGSECVPVCDNVCENGFCIAPNKCECHEGYIHAMHPNQENICLPTCDGLEGNEGCINGTCIAVNKCQCAEGLIFNPTNRFECIPYPVDVVELQHKRSWYIYLLLGLLILLLMIILLLLALRKFHQDSYNVEKVEKCRASVQYRNV